MNRLKFKKKAPFVAQFQMSDCGLVCVSMILRYYDSYISMNHLSEILEVGRDGATIQQINEF